MAVDLTFAYVGLMLILFFFWAYGIVSFVLDLKNKIVPGIRRYRRGREVRKAEQESDREREERERQLY